MTAGRELDPVFQHSQYLFRRKVFKLFGGAFYVYDEAGRLAFFGEQKAFKLKEDFRVYADEKKSRELLIIKTPKILDISATYSVTDATNGEPVGALRRRGLKSLISDEWIFLSREGQEIGKLKEKSIITALLSRWSRWVPQTYVITSPGEKEVAQIQQHFNPFVLKYTMTLSENPPSIDPRLLLSAGILLCGIEMRQQ